jgi:hypothetical protein
MQAGWRGSEMQLSWKQNPGGENEIMRERERMKEKEARKGKR